MIAERRHARERTSAAPWHTVCGGMRRAHLATAGLAAFALALPASASAQGTVPADGAGGAGASAAGGGGAQAAAARPARTLFALGVPGTFALGADRIGFVGRTIRVRGVLSRYVRGQVVTIRFTRTGATRKVVRRTVQRVPGSRKGFFLAEYRPGADGRVRIKAVHARTSRQVRFVGQRVVDVIRPEADFGAGGLRVRFLQRRLHDLRFKVNLTGVFDRATGRAVLAFRKVNGFGRIRSAGPRIFGMLGARKGRFVPKYPSHGRHAEGDLRRQVLALINADGSVFRVYHMSSGKPSTPTVRGSFRVQWHRPGTNSHGMVNSSFFYGGYAVHGYPDVPTYPASHGCLRIPIPNSRAVMRWLTLGTPIDVYRSR